jgi:hypothetical protein
MEMIPARNAMDVHAQNFVSLADYTLLEMLDIFNLCLVAEPSVAPL